MKKLTRRFVSLVLCILIAAALALPAAAETCEETGSSETETAEDGGSEVTTITAETTVDEDGNVLSSTVTEVTETTDADGNTEVTETTEDLADDSEEGTQLSVLSASETEAETETETEAETTKVTLVSTEKTYSLKITVTTKAVSSKDDTVKTVKVSKPKLTTVTTKTYSDGSTKESSKTVTYGLTVKCYVRCVGWKKASLTSSGTAYKYTASKSSSGKYISAVRITPSDNLKAAMKTAGITFYYRADTEYFGELGWAKAGLCAGTTGNNCPMTGLELKVVTTSDGKKLSTDNRYISYARVQYKTRSTGASSWSSPVINGSTSGKKSASASIGAIAIKSVKSSSGFSISGGIKYSIRTTNSDSSSNWSDYVSNYTKAGSKNSEIQAIKIKLTGDMADYYDVYYRVYVGNYGWLDWAKNGEKAGTKGIGLSIGAIQIKLVPKGADAPGDTDEHYINSISGDSTLDSYLYKIYKKKGTNLKTLFYYVANTNNFKYIRTYDTPSGSWKTWSIEYAKQLYENKGGNCYRYAALFCWLARGLGYNAKTVKGYVPSRSKGWAPHGWCEIKINGTTYICDPDMVQNYPTRNWYMQTYSNSTTTYKKSS